MRGTHFTEEKSKLTDSGVFKNFFSFFYDKNFSKFFGHGVTNFWSPRDQFWSRRDQNDFGHEAARPPF